MEEEIARALGRKAENTQKSTPIVQQMSSTSSMGIGVPKVWGSNDAKRMSFDENVPQYGTSPLSSMLSQSPGSAWANPEQGRPRRDSLKNMWHLQDFGTD